MQHFLFWALELILLGAPYVSGIIPPLLGQGMFWAGVVGLLGYLAIQCWRHRHRIGRRVEPSHLIGAGLVGVLIFATMALAGFLWDRHRTNALVAETAVSSIEIVFDPNNDAYVNNEVGTFGSPNTVVRWIRIGILNTSDRSLDMVAVYIDRMTSEKGQVVLARHRLIVDQNYLPLRKGEEVRVTIASMDLDVEGSKIGLAAGGAYDRGRYTLEVAARAEDAQPITTEFILFVDDSGLLQMAEKMGKT